MENTDILRIDPKHRVGISVRNISVTVKNQQKKNKKDDQEELGGAETKIIDDVSFDVHAGQMLAIMGGSGSGKTTLLNTLSQRLNHTNKKLKFSGEIKYTSDNDNSQIKNSYLQQTDVFLPGLTVLETLKYQAALRLPKNTSELEMDRLIDSLLNILELTHRKDEIIKSFTNKIHLSGGEQRRVSLAIQLLNRPSILFLDEPTTGLDTSTSLKLVKALKSLSSFDYGITIILSIHQPRPEIVSLFDRICLLTRGGRIIYYGNLAESSHYFHGLNKSSINFDTEEINQKNNLLEYIMDLSIKDTSSKEQELVTSRKIDFLAQNWKLHTNSQPLTLSKKEQSHAFAANVKRFERVKEERISFTKELIVLTKRTFKVSYRDIQSLIALNGFITFLAIVCGYIFFKPLNDLAGIRSKTSSLYVMLEVVGFAPMFIEIERLWAHDGVNFFREYNERYSSIMGFVLSRRLAKLFLEDLPIAFIFACITYFMWGLRMSETPGDPTSSSYFFIYLALTVLTNFCGMATAMVCFSLANDFSISVLIANCFYQLQNSACGYFVNAATMPVYVRWMKYCAYFWYDFGALAANQFTNWEGDCPHEKGSIQCLEYTGNYQLSVLGFPKHWIGEPIGILCAWFVGFHVIIYFALLLRNYDMEVAKTKKNRIGEADEDDDEEKDVNESKPSASTEGKEKQHPEKMPKSTEMEPVATTIDNDNLDIDIHNIRLSVSIKERLMFWKEKEERVLLDDVSASFKANKLNAIMGPSGSGKTTLLTYLASRLPKTSSFHSSGIMKINDNQTISTQKLARISAFVTQHDNSLIPRLTVRETLYYQAKLRVPLESHPKILNIINKLIRQTGLVDCADTLVGSEIVKGISGGEKRRLSIAIQLLSKPKVIFLDEPSSGLDSTTAASILKLLEDLAITNKTTVIMTIHQPSEEMFQSFDSILLLGKGGQVVYNGPSDRIESHFASVGYENSQGVHTADFILDLISTGLEETKEEATARTDYLIQAWKSKASNKDPLLLTQDTDSSNQIDLRKFYKSKLPLWVTFTAIAKRQSINNYRAVDIMFARAFQVILLAIVHTLFFAPLRNGRDGIDNRLGLVQEVLNLYFVGLINNISIYPTERDIFYQEYRDGIYGVFEFHSSYFINEVPVEVVSCLFLAAMLVFVCGLPRNPGMFFSMFLSSFVCVNTGDSLGITVNSLFNHLGLASNLLACVCTLAVFMGGTMSLELPMFVQIWNFLNPLKYAVGICVKLGFQGQKFDCTNAKGENFTAQSECSLRTGEDVLNKYHMNNHLSGFYGALVACFVLYRAISFASTVIRVRWFI